MPPQRPDQAVRAGLGVGQRLVQRLGLLDQRRDATGAAAGGDAVRGAVGRGGCVARRAGTSGTGSPMVTSSCGCPTGPAAGTVPPDSMRTASSDGPIADSRPSGCQRYALRPSRQATGSSGPTTCDLGEPQPHRPRQEVAAGVQPHRLAGVAGAAQDQLGDAAPALGAGAHGDRAVEVDGHRRVGGLAAGQPVERPPQEPRVLGVEAEPGGRRLLGGDRLLDAREAGVGPDRQPDRPRPGPEHDVGVRPAHLDRPVAGQPAAGEQRRAADQQVALPGEAEAALDEDLPAVGGDHLAGVALELEAVQGVAGRALVGRRDGLGQGVEQAAGAGLERRRRLGERRQAREIGDGVLAGLGDAPVLPADDGPARRGGLQDDGDVVPALEVGQGVQRQGDRRLGPVGARQDVLDGQVGQEVPDAEADVRVGAEDERGHRPLVGDAQGVAAEDGAQATGLAARDRDHGRGVLQLGDRRSRGTPMGRGELTVTSSWPAPGRGDPVVRQPRTDAATYTSLDVEVEARVAAGALGQRARAVGELAGVEGGLAAPRAVDDQVERLGLAAGRVVGQDREPEAVDGDDRLAGGVGDLVVELGLGHGSLLLVGETTSGPPAARARRPRGRWGRRCEDGS